MSCSKTFFIQLVFGLCIFFTLLTSSCKKDSSVIPNALNSFKGVAEGTSFTAELASATDTDELYIITGIINSDASFILYFKGNNLVEHPIDTSGPLVETVNILNAIADSILNQITNPDFNLDTALAELNEVFTENLDSVFQANNNQVLIENHSFLFYVINNSIYYSKSGLIELTRYDAELNRIDGNFNIELRNLSQGVKSFEGDFEDVEFTK